LNKILDFIKKTNLDLKIISLLFIVVSSMILLLRGIERLENQKFFFLIEMSHQNSPKKTDFSHPKDLSRICISFDKFRFFLGIFFLEKFFLERRTLDTLTLRRRLDEVFDENIFFQNIFFTLYLYYITQYQKDINIKSF